MKEVNSVALSSLIPPPSSLFMPAWPNREEALVRVLHNLALRYFE